MWTNMLIGEALMRPLPPVGSKSFQGYCLDLLSMIMNVIARLLFWSCDQLRAAVLGLQRWGVVKYYGYVMGLLLLLGCIAYGLDLVLKPVVWCCQRTYAWYRYLRGIPEETKVVSVGECDWRGPGTPTPADDVFYKQLRRRSDKSRTPNNLPGAPGRVCSSG